MTKIKAVLIAFFTTFGGRDWTSGENWRVLLSESIRYSESLKFQSSKSKSYPFLLNLPTPLTCLFETFDFFRAAKKLDGMYEIKWQTIVNLSILENASNVYSMWEYKHHRKRFFFERAYVKNRDDFVRKFRICYPLATDSRKQILLEFTFFHQVMLITMRQVNMFLKMEHGSLEFPFGTLSKRWKWQLYLPQLYLQRICLKLLSTNDSFHKKAHEFRSLKVLK